MSPADRRLTRHLVLAIAVKLVVLVGLWWFLVRGQSVDADSEHTAAHLLVPVTSETIPTGAPQ